MINYHTYFGILIIILIELSQAIFHVQHFIFLNDELIIQVYLEEFLILSITILMNHLLLQPLFIKAIFTAFYLF